MGTKFTLEIDLTDHEHHENPMAQRQFVVQQLHHAAQAIGSNYTDPRVKTGEHGVTKDHPSIVHAWGEITIPSVGATRGGVIGSWEFVEEV
jgi:hypothetical protein